MSRYFASLINDEQIFLTQGDVHHLLNVMRGTIGTKLTAIYEAKSYDGEVISINPLIIKNLGLRKENNRELLVETTLFFALAKGDKIDFVIQKATELGVKRIVLIKTERCVVKMDNDDFARKLERYLKIAKEASEQCERNVIPEILGIYDIKKIPNQLLSSINFVAYECQAFDKIDFSMIDNHPSASILIGPEGGIAPKEIEALIQQGFKSVSLGKRILRTETAAVAGLAMMNQVIEK